MQIITLLLGCLMLARGLVVTTTTSPPVSSVSRSVVSSRGVVMEVTQCAMIDLSTDDPTRIANTLKKAWMEGAVKRGLVGSVLVPSDNVVTIVAMGPRKRLDSFAEWVETSSQLVSKVTMSDACPTVELTDKFEIADSNAETPWLDVLKQANIDVKDSEGKTHSSDEGLV